MLFPPTVWGPFFWHTIHIVALGYPKNPTYTDKKCTKEFYESFAYLIPCSQCREHYKEHISKTQMLLTGKEKGLWKIISSHNIMA